MEPVTTAYFVGSVAAPIIGGALGSILSSGDRDRAERAAEAAYAEIARLGAGPNLARQIFYRNFQQVGILTPELEEAIELAAPKVAQIQEAPELRKAQMTALELIGQRATTGMGPEDRARLLKFNFNKLVIQKQSVTNLQSYHTRSWWSGV